MADRARGTRSGCSRRTGRPACPAGRYAGDDPDGYMTMPEVADFIDALRRPDRGPGAHRYHGHPGVGTAPPATATRSSPTAARGRARRVVLASGAATSPTCPRSQRRVPPSDRVDAHPMTYRASGRPRRAGRARRRASATGVQLADEIHRSGRPVTLAVGEHVRLPRTLPRARHLLVDRCRRRPRRTPRRDRRPRPRPSRPVTATRRHARAADRSTSTRSPSEGFGIVGRLAGIDRRGRPVLRRPRQRLHARRPQDEPPPRPLDDWAAANGHDDVAPSAAIRADPRAVEADARGRPAAGDIGTVIWATGYRPDHSWLDLPVLDRTGRIRHDGGVVNDAPGTYLLGANLLRRRRSSYISGAASRHPRTRRTPPPPPRHPVHAACASGRAMTLQRQCRSWRRALTRGACTP